MIVKVYSHFADDFCAFLPHFADDFYALPPHFADDFYAFSPHFADDFFWGGVLLFIGGGGEGIFDF